MLIAFGESENINIKKKERKESVVLPGKLKKKNTAFTMADGKSYKYLIKKKIIIIISNKFVLFIKVRTNAHKRCQGRQTRTWRNTLFKGNIILTFI